MAAWSEISLSNTFARLNLAGDHYHPAKLAALQDLGRKSNQCVFDLASHIKELADNNLDVPIFDLGAASCHILNFDDAQSIERVSTKKIARGQDVIISRLRAYLRQVAYIPQELGKVGLSTEFYVLRGHQISFLVPFFLTRRVQTILQWSQDGNTHPRFSEEILFNLPIPDSVVAQRDKLNKLMLQAETQLIKSKECSLEAEVILATALSLAPMNHQNTSFSEQNASYALVEGRLDAEFFQPYYQNLLSKLRSGGQRIGSVASLIKTSFRPIADIPFNYIEISDLRGDGGFNHTELDGADAPSRAEFAVNSGDVLTSTVRPIRRLTGIVGDELEGAVCSSGFAVLRPHSVTPELLRAYLRLPPVAEILDLYTTASMYPAISTDNLMRIPFLYPGKSVEDEITKKMHEARAARYKSMLLLNQAIQDVEQLI